MTKNLAATTEHMSNKIEKKVPVEVNPFDNVKLNIENIFLNVLYK